MFMKDIYEPAVSEVNRQLSLANMSCMGILNEYKQYEWLVGQHVYAMHTY